MRATFRFHLIGLFLSCFVFAITPDAGAPGPPLRTPPDPPGGPAGTLFPVNFLTPKSPYFGGVFGLRNQPLREPPLPVPTPHKKGPKKVLFEGGPLMLAHLALARVPTPTFGEGILWVFNPI
jgi:hypothetical protein